MFWKVICEDRAEASQHGLVSQEGRFVLHRHHDAGGPHLDLRLEQDGFLLGWRIEGLSLEGEPWATEKAPHPCDWLEQAGDAVREDAGVYAWLDRDESGGVLALQGENGVRWLRIRRETGLGSWVVRSICEALVDTGAAADDAARLIVDGMTARRRAIERFCGLGRELDGSAFDEAVWRKTLEGLTLDEIHAQLRAYEVRFDQKYPPQPVSRPEVLPEDKAEGRLDAAMAILRE